MLTDDEAAQISMFMRVMEFGQKHADLIANNPAMAAAMTEAKEKVQEIMDQLTEEERNQVLERFQADKARREAEAAGGARPAGAGGPRRAEGTEAE